MSDPALPEGYKWSVIKGVDGTPKLLLRKKVKFIGIPFWVTVQSSYFFPDILGSVEAAMQYAARDLYTSEFDNDYKKYYKVVDRWNNDR